MTDFIEPTHHRLISSFKAIGPYLRENSVDKGRYLFDCLSVCLDDAPSPELREFWGWWLQLVQSDSGFIAHYSLGKYNKLGDWEAVSIPEHAQLEVEKSLELFHGKLEQLLTEKYQSTLTRSLEPYEMAI